MPDPIQTGRRLRESGVCHYGRLVPRSRMISQSISSRQARCVTPEIGCVDNIFLSDAWSVGLLLESCESALVQNNIVRLNQSYPLQHISFDQLPPQSGNLVFSPNVSTFNNLTAEGKVITMVRNDGYPPVREVSSTVEDAILLSFL